MASSSKALNGSKDPRTIARKYQLELCKKAMEENIIVYLGTGCGKTHIAVLLMYELGHLIRKPNEAVCVFLAPTVPLVRQQAMVIENSTDFKVGSYFGSRKHTKDHTEWNEEMKQYEVLVMTPQILLHSLRHCFIRMDVIELLIFDECHHAQVQKRHPYAQIIKEFYKTNSTKRPRIFGMTASPSIGKGGSNQLNYTKCINSLENLLEAKVCSVDDNIELESIVASPEIKVYFYGPVVYSSSSLILAYCKKLESVKHQFSSMVREKICDVKDSKKTIRLLWRMHDNLIFCLENIGLCGGLQAVRSLLSSEGFGMAEMDMGESSSGACLAYQYLNKAASILSCNILNDDIGSDSFVLETLDEPFFSKKLSVLIGILSSYRRKENMKCIIFVKRIIVARSLANVLGSVRSLDFWKCEFLVGLHSGLRNMSRKKMNDIVERFSSGEVNLLVATSVAEEGLDIQTCCLVVRFDLPETVSSFIQSRGRARMLKSEYAFLVERGNQHDEQLLNDFMSGEEIMNKEILSRTSNDTFDDLEETFYKVDSTGASITTGCSVSLLHHYCSKLPRDIYFTPSPKFIYVDDLGGTVCRVILPPNAPFRQVDSLPCPSINEARRAACLKACTELHERGALTDYLLPNLCDGEKKRLEVDHSACDSNEDGHLGEELHEKLVPTSLKVPWFNSLVPTNMYFYFIRLVPIPEDREYRKFGLFVKDPLPKEAETMEVDLHLAHGRIVKTGIFPVGRVTFDSEQIILAENYQEMFLKIILDRSEYFADRVTLGKNNAAQHDSSTFYLFLPVKQQLYGEIMTVDWQNVKCCLSSPAFGCPFNPYEKDPFPATDSVVLLSGPVYKSIVVNSLVFTPHNRLFFFIDGILHGTNGNNQVKGSIVSYAEHYKHRFRIQLSHPEQPLLKAKQLFSLRNLLHNRIQRSTESCEMEEHFVELPPEVCVLKIVGFSKDIGSSLSLFPSLIHRLENLLVAIELKEILSASFPDGSEIRADCILEALTTEKCLERFSLERFEVLGDAFLKYAVGRHCFLSYEGLDEGQLTRKRSSLVNNLYLYELAIKNNLQVFIHNESFDPSQFYALGRPCKLVCDVDTESTVHRQHGNNAAEVGAVTTDVKCTKSHRWLHRKTIADVVEALVGAFLVEGGFKAAIAFLKWIGIQVDFEVSDVYKICKESKSNMALIQNVDVDRLEELLAYNFKHKGLLLQALVHPSYNKHSGGCYQKLEFLGDAVLEYLITSYLYSVYPDLKPGQITDLRSIAVNNNSFAHVAVSQSFHKYLISDSSSLTEAVNKFESYVNLSDSEGDLLEEPACPKVLGDIVESCIGAILLDAGFSLKHVWQLMLKILEPVLHFSNLQLHPVRELRELCQSYAFELRLPDPEKVRGGYFVKVEIKVEGKYYTFSATNNNSKSARRMASQDALSKLKGLGFKHKSKSLEETVRATRVKEPELIGFDEDPIVFEEANEDSIVIEESNVALEKLDIQEPDNAQPMYRLLRRGEGSSAFYQHSVPSGSVEKPRSVACEAYRASKGQHEVETTGGNKMARSRISELCTANYWKPPSFVCCKEEGPSHLKMYTYKAELRVDGSPPTLLERYGEPKPQKKAAQEHAAEGMLWYLKHLGYLSKP